MIVVLGDLARSPRMLRHASAAMQHGMLVDLIGFRGQPLPPQMTAARLRTIPSFSSVRLEIRFASLAAAALRQLLLAAALMARLLTAPRPDVLVVQTPPLLPALPVILFVARIRRIRVIVDWHNSTAAMVRARYGRGVIATIVGRIERSIAQRLRHHLAVSAAMAEQLSIRSTVLRDLPPANFVRATHRTGFEAAPGLHRHAPIIDTDDDAPPLIVAPSSWSIDDDFDLLIDALRDADARLRDGERLVLALTGYGERRTVIENAIDALQLTRIAVVTGWLTEPDFIALLGSADAGLSLHRSASGVDIPIKIAEMIGCGVPIIALDYGSALRETAGTDATYFRSANDLAEALLTVARREGKPPQQATASWEAEWDRLAWPMLGGAPRILFLQPSLQPPGGGNAVAVCALHALKDDFDVSILAWERVGFEAIRRDYGVPLAARDFDIRYVSRFWPALLRLIGVRGALLQRYALLRAARRVAGNFDAVVSFNNEIDVGDVPTVQYIHFPWGIWPRPEADLRAIHRIPGVLHAYYAIGRALAPVSPAQIARNVTLVNSDWTGEQFRNRYGGTTTTVYPPLMGTPSPRPWDEREDTIIALGVFARHKRLELIVDIVERLRARGYPLRLLIVGARDRHHAAYARQIAQMANARSWIEMRENPSRAEVDDILGRVRYGLHAMADEHFGMAVAEMTAAGCIPFVPRRGGQVEVVGGNEQLLYDNVDDAVTKIAHVIDNPDLQHSLSASLIDSASRFRRDRFRDRIRSVVSSTAERKPANDRVVRVALAAGGTAGHVYPALAVAEEMRRRGWEVTFVGTPRGREDKLIRRAGFQPVLLPGAPYHRTNWLGRAASIAGIPLAVAASSAFLRRRRIDAVIGFGGYASVGPVLAARLLGRWSAILEPNADMGKANRLLVRGVDRIYIAGHTDAGHAPSAVLRRVGTPMRAEFAGAAPAPESNARKCILVFGDEFLNAHIPAVINAVSRAVTVDVVHQGARIANYESSIPVRYADHFDDVWREYAAADLVISRAGAGTLAEIASVGRAALIVPLRTAAEDHQTRNAALWQERDAAVVVSEQRWDSAQVADRLATLLADDAARAAMAARAHEIFVPGATARLVDDVAACLTHR
jgi:UDP-N-acetylglucosamine--N-acetylmuramyl-(pentapeptide) pyrophosphoryl-undecaprenol N-acetylglucosamine transferase